MLLIMALAIHDLTPEFWRFWDAAQNQPVERQAQLWQQLYVAAHQAVSIETMAHWSQAEAKPKVRAALEEMSAGRYTARALRLDGPRKRF